MKYSKATNYALHTMLYLCSVSSDKPVGVQQLAQKQGVSPSYLSGANGGYRLKGRKEDISFLDIIHAVEGSASLFECCGSEDSRCVIQQVMLAAEEAMERHLENTKMIELVDTSSCD